MGLFSGMLSSSTDRLEQSMLPAMVCEANSCSFSWTIGLSLQTLVSLVSMTLTEVGLAFQKEQICLDGSQKKNSLVGSRQKHYGNFVGRYGILDHTTPPKALSRL